jgi:hypothetical protein
MKCEKCFEDMKESEAVLVRVRYIVAPYGGIEAWCPRCYAE